MLKATKINIEIARYLQRYALLDKSIGKLQVLCDDPVELFLGNP